MRCKLIQAHPAIFCIPLVHLLTSQCDVLVSLWDVVSSRILQLYAEENAIDDTIYYLGEALRKGVIELDIFLKV